MGETRKLRKSMMGDEEAQAETCIARAKGEEPSAREMPPVGTTVSFDSVATMGKTDRRGGRAWW